MGRIWTAETDPHSQRLDHWSDAVCEAFLDMKAPCVKGGLQRRIEGRQNGRSDV